MATKRPSVQKREMEFKKRQRQQKKAAKAAEKREARLRDAAPTHVPDGTIRKDGE